MIICIILIGVVFVTIKSFRDRGINLSDLNDLSVKKYGRDMIQEFKMLVKCEKLSHLNGITDPTDITISMSLLPKRFKDSIRNISPVPPNWIINIPKEYRYYDYDSNDLKHFTSNNGHVSVNIIPIDLGPGSKIFGLCNVFDDVKEIIIYLDDDIEYSFSQLRQMAHIKQQHPNVILGTLGGIWNGGRWDTKLNTIGVDLIEWAYNIRNPKCFHEVNVIYGFGAVIMSKDQLWELCNINYLDQLTNCPSCFYVDDEWVSYNLNQSGNRLLTTRIHNPILELDQSEVNQDSYRMNYQVAAHNCESCLNGVRKVTRSKLIIMSFFINEKSVHPMKEYLSTVKKFIKNHESFALINGYKYTHITEKKTDKGHWMKLWIINDFLKSCAGDELLFYTDMDFWFLNNLIPSFMHDRSIIVSKGCDVDFIQYMTGNMFVKCDKDLLPFMESWFAATKVLNDGGELIDDQLAFNILSPKIKHKLQVDPFMTYDFCPHDKSKILGVHFPGEDKLNRLLNYNKLLTLN